MLKPLMSRVALVIVGAALMSAPKAAHACSVCQGDPNNQMVQGAQAGVLFMVITTYVLLLGMAALVASWFIRQNRRLRRVQLESGTANVDGDTSQDTPHA